MRETWVQSRCWEDPLEKGTGCTHQYSGLENSMDVTKSWTRLNDFHFHVGHYLGLARWHLEEGMATHSSILAWRIPMDRGAWLATVCGVAKSQTRLSD